MRKLDLLQLGVILVFALAIRVWAPWDDVLGGERVNFLETDAWYHVRLVENAVRHFPHRVTADPYASVDAQYVAVAPLFDAIVATVVMVTRGAGASTAYIERVAALAPPLMGAGAVVAVWWLATLAFDRRAGLLAALLAAILPGHFLDRTLVGFVDHHALEACLAMATLAAIVWAGGLSSPDSRLPSPVSRLPSPVSRLPIPGIFLGLYLLAWGSGALLVAIIGAWVAALPFVCGDEARRAHARVALVTAVVAAVVVLLLQDPGLFRYDTQVASLAGLIVLALVALSTRPRLLLAGSAVVVVAAAVLLAPGLTRQVMSDLVRFSPDPTRMAVLEARPLFLYTGNWNWWQPWTFFRSGFYVGAVAVALLGWSVWRSRRADHLLVALFTVAMFVATLGQNRFGYYLVPAVAVVIAWLATRVFDWGGVPHAGNPSPDVRRVMPFQREAAVVLVAGLAVAPNLAPAAITTTRAGGMPGYWFDAMTWLRDHTPEPFADAAYYYARYPAQPAAPAYTVMNWWDQGYWIAQTARRVPVANPTQVRAPNAARFYVATDEAEALRLLAAERARYVLSDWEQPFRDAGGGSLGGRLQSLADWAGVPTSRFYTVCYANSPSGWQPVWMFREPYYQSMAYRLMVLGGAASAPANNTWVVRLENRVDTTGRAFCEVTDRRMYPSADEARAAARQAGGQYEAVGLTPWQPAFPVPALTGLTLIRDIREPGQAANEAPMVRIFEVKSER